MNLKDIPQKHIDKNYRRCLICDFCSMGETDDTRHFTWDEIENGWNCNHCKSAIQDDLEDTLKDGPTTYWLNLAERRATDEEFSKASLPLEKLPGPVDPLQARLNRYPEVDDGS